MKETHVGSNFDDFLREEGLLEEVEAVGAKRVLAYQTSEAMKEQDLSKSARRDHRPGGEAPRRLLPPHPRLRG